MKIGCLIFSYGLWIIELFYLFQTPMRILSFSEFNTFKNSTILSPKNLENDRIYLWLGTCFLGSKNEYHVWLYRMWFYFKLFQFSVHCRFTHIIQQ